MVWENIVQLPHENNIRRFRTTYVMSNWERPVTGKEIKLDCRKRRGGGGVGWGHAKAKSPHSLKRMIEAFCVNPGCNEIQMVLLLS